MASGDAFKDLYERIDEVAHGNPGPVFEDLADSVAQLIAQCLPVIAGLYFAVTEPIERVACKGRLEIGEDAKVHVRIRGFREGCSKDCIRRSGALPNNRDSNTDDAIGGKVRPGVPVIEEAVEKILLPICPIVPVEGGHQIREALGQTAQHIRRLAGIRIEFPGDAHGKGPVSLRPWVGAIRPFQWDWVGPRNANSAHESGQEISGDSLVEGFVALFIVPG
jgi:hypothetical protein